MTSHASWDERQPTRRRPREADVDEDDVLLDDEEDDDENEDDDAYYQTRLPARARYVPLAQRDAPLPPLQSPLRQRPVYVVDRRGQGSPRRASLPPRQQQARLSPPPPSPRQQQVRRTQDDPVVYRQQPVPTRRDEEEGPFHPHPPRRHHGGKQWVFFVGMGMIGMLLLWYLSTALLSWLQVYQDDLHYGRPRTFQCDAVVGHNDSIANPSHFIALNLHHQVEIIEFPGGDSTHAKIYLGPTLAGPGQDLAVVTLTFKDVNGDGKPDMLVNVLGSHFTFMNDHGQFRLARPGEQVNP